MRNEEYCDRCLPEKSVPAMGYIPLPEMTNIGDTRVDERKILLCNFHYFEAKKNCYYVVPFNRDDDPVDSFLTRVKRKHNLVRGNAKLKFKPPRYQEKEETLDPVILEDFPKPRRIRNTSNQRGIPHNTGFRKLGVVSPEDIRLSQPRQSRNGNSKRSKRRKVHFRKDSSTYCGLSAENLDSTEDQSVATCQNCLDMLNLKSVKQEVFEERNA